MGGFLDIFRKGVDGVEKPTVVVDWREKNSLVVSELMRLGLNVKFEQLAVGDYIAGGVAIERKTLKDFKASIIDKRIFDQLAALKQYTEYLLIIEGLENRAIYDGSIHENALRGCLLSIVHSYKVPILFTLNERDTAKYLALLARRNEKTDVALRASKRVLTDAEQVQFILEGFAGVGPVMAKKLIATFGSLHTIMNAGLEELEKVLGKRAKEMYTLIHNSNL